MKLFVFWIEEESRWIYVRDNTLADSIREHYESKNGYVEYYMIIEDNKIKDTDYAIAVIGNDFNGVIDDKSTLILK